MKVVFLASGGGEYNVERSAWRKLAWESWQAAGYEPEFLFDDQGWGCQRAGYMAMEKALEGSDFGVVTFDDVIVAPDVMEYFTWAEEMFRSEPAVGTISAFQLGVRLDAKLGDFYQVELSPVYTCGCWGTWKHNWEDIFKPVYNFDERYGFDIQMREVIFPSHGLNQVFPTWARAQNIGGAGTHMRPHMLQAHESHPFAGDYEKPDLVLPDWHIKEGD
jgi:hypothetical protein